MIGVSFGFVSVLGIYILCFKYVVLFYGGV